MDNPQKNLDELSNAFAKRLAEIDEDFKQRIRGIWDFDAEPANVANRLVALEEKVRILEAERVVIHPKDGAENPPPADFDARCRFVDEFIDAHLGKTIVIGTRPQLLQLVERSVASMSAMFQETRRRMCRAVGVSEGESWSWLESELPKIINAQIAIAHAHRKTSDTHLPSKGELWRSCISGGPSHGCWVVANEEGVIARFKDEALAIEYQTVFSDKV